MIDLNRPYTCDFCHKQFVQERTLITHVCETKRRHQMKNDPVVKQAFHSYTKIFQNLNPTKAHMIPSYQEFTASMMWPSLIKFHAWCQEQLVQECEQFVFWLLNRNVALHNWCDIRLYNEFLQELLISESAEQALKRSLKVVHDWHVNSQKSYSDFFESVNCNQLTQWIQQGKISAWLLYNCKTAENYFLRCTPEQLGIIQQTAPITKWKVKFLRLSDQVAEIKNVLQEAGL